MESLVSPLPPGTEQAFAPGPEEVIVARLADPVQLRPAGDSAAFPLRFFDKRRRANAGAWIFSAPGGRAEILWPSGTTAVLFDRCTAIVGSPSRGEPEIIFRTIERVVLNLTPGDQVELMGGAQLSADSGPWLIERRLFDILRVRNQSKVPGEVAYRDQVFVLAADETVDLPLLSAGGRPSPKTPGTRSVAGPGFDVDIFGGVQVVDERGALGLQAHGEHEISGLGIRLHLDDGERAIFSGLSGAPERMEPSRGSEPSPTVEAGEPTHQAAPDGDH